MAGACSFILWNCYMMMMMMMMMMASLNIVSGGAVPSVGVNWGNIASHPLNPNIVVNMLKDNGITKVKLFDADSWTVNALAGTGIEVMLAIPNNMLKIMADDFDNAKDWVQENVTSHLKDTGGVNIRYVAVGNEPFLKSYNGTFDKTTFPALQNIQKALNEAKIGDKIKATVPLNADVYEGQKPSDGDFRKDIKTRMLQIVKHLHENNSPFVVNIYPFISLHQTVSFPFDYAFFDSSSSPIRVGNISYTNLFDANFDTLVWTLRKNGYRKMKIIVGEVGWPTDGSLYANANLAKRFYDGLLKKLAAKKGTPLQPGVALDVYLFSLLDEDMKSNLPGDFERHWGIFRYDGKPKFPMDLSGQGNDNMLVEAKGVQYLPKQWCVLNKDVKNKSMLPAEINYACSLADCTSLGYGSSCNNLDLNGNFSYAFNMYFQMNDQDVEACDFNSMATIVTQNASRGTCLFPIQIVSEGVMLKLGYWATFFAGSLFAFFML